MREDPPKKPVPKACLITGIALLLAGCLAAGWWTGRLYMQKDAGNVYEVEDGKISAVDVTEIALTKTVYPVTDEDVALAAESTGMDETEVRAEMEDVLEAKSLESLREEALLAVAYAAKTFEPSEERLAEYEEGTMDAYESYMEYFNTDNMDDIYELFQTSEDGIREEAKDILYERMAVGMLLEEYDLYLTEDEMNAALADLAEENGYENPETFLEEYGESAARYIVFYNTAADYVIAHATVTEEEGSL